MPDDCISDGAPNTSRGRRRIGALQLALMPAEADCRAWSDNPGVIGEAWGTHNLWVRGGSLTKGPF